MSMYVTGINALPETKKLNNNVFKSPQVETMKKSAPLEYNPFKTIDVTTKRKKPENDRKETRKEILEEFYNVYKPKVKNIPFFLQYKSTNFAQKSTDASSNAKKEFREIIETPKKPALVNVKLEKLANSGVPPYTVIYQPQASKRDHSKQEKKEKPQSNEASHPTSQVSKTIELTSKFNILSEPVMREPLYFTYFLGKGNNDILIKRILKKRYWFKEGSSGNYQYNFYWQQASKGLPYDRLNTTRDFKQAVNHFEYHREISSKIHLIKNLQNFCEQNQRNVFDLTPTTFIIDYDNKNVDNDILDFMMFFLKYSSNANEDLEVINKFKTGMGKGSPQGSTRFNSFNCFPKIPKTFIDKCNLWLLKPTEYNRGRGINLFNKLSTFKDLVQIFLKNDDSAKVKSQGNDNSNNASQPQITQNQNINLVRTHKFVVQKYVEKPLLFNSRKFDARVWALLDQDNNLYYFKEWYIRLSSEKFDLNENLLENQYIHLTNNAIQKYGPNYGKQESGNILPWTALRDYMQDNSKITIDKVIGKMKELIKISFSCVRNKINMYDRRGCFEIFGFDFLIDEEFNVWLIEINTNPSIDESNKYLSTVIPRMIDDAFRITIDKIFIPTNRNYKTEDIKLEKNIEFPVEGYDQYDNIWEFIMALNPRISKRR